MMKKAHITGIVFILLALSVPVFAQSKSERQALEFFEQGKAYYEQKDYYQAINSFNLAISKKKNLADAYYWRGNAYFGLKDYDKAIADYTAALRLKPDDSVLREAALRIMPYELSAEDLDIEQNAMGEILIGRLRSNLEKKHVNLIIPGTIEGIKVVEIDEQAFFERGIIVITLPNTIRSIGHGAFVENRLTSVIIPAGVKTIEPRAFAYNQLTEIILPSGLQTIGHEAFADNELTKIVIPAGVKAIGWGAFAGNQLTEITLGSELDLTNSGFDYRFINFYQNQGRRAGTYVRKGQQIWSRQ